MDREANFVKDISQEISGSKYNNPFITYKNNNNILHTVIEEHYFLTVNVGHIIQ